MFLSQVQFEKLKYVRKIAKIDYRLVMCVCLQLEARIFMKFDI
jgi:hypothetical protein